MIHAYDKVYLEKARTSLARMLDFAVYDLHYDIKVFFNMFINSGIAARFEKEECASCSAGCAKRNHAFEVANPHNMEISSGSIVIIGANKKVQAAQGIVSLFIPFLCAIAGYFAASPIMNFFGKSISSDGKAVFVLLFLLLSSALVFAVTRKIPIPGKPEIIEVL